MSKPRGWQHVCVVIFALLTLCVSCSVLATSKPFNPDTRSMDVRVISDCVYLSGQGAGINDICTNLAGSSGETATPNGWTIDGFLETLKGLAGEACHIQPGYVDSTGGFAVGTGNLLGGMSYPGAVVCNYKEKNPYYIPGNPNYPEFYDLSLTVSAGTAALYGTCPYGFKPDPFNDNVNDELSSLRCVPKTGFNNSNQGVSETCSMGPNPRPEEGGCTTDHPVHLGTGNKILSEVDYIGSGPMPLKWIRYYNSFPNPISLDYSAAALIPGSSDDLKTVISPLGQQWFHSYQFKISVVTDTTGTHVIVLRPSGRVLQFEKNNIGTWIASQGLTPDERLNEITDVSGATTGWRWTRADDTIEDYDNQGLLLSITTREGLVTKLTYAGGGGEYPSNAPLCVLPSGSPTASAPVPVNRLQCVTDPQGHQLNLQYNSAGQIQRMIDPLGKETDYLYVSQNVPREVRVPGYTGPIDYVEALVLTQVTYPDQSGRQYLYAENGLVPSTIPGYIWLLTGILENASTDGSTNWIRYSTYSYDTNLRVTNEYLAGNVENYNFTNNSPTAFSWVVGPDGQYVNSNFTTLGNGQIKMTSDKLGGQYTYDSNGNAIMYVWPRFIPGQITGGVSTFNYDSQNRRIEVWDGVSVNSQGTVQPDSTSQHQVITWYGNTRLPSTITEDIPFNKSDGTQVAQGKRVTTFTYDAKNRLTKKVIQAEDGDSTTVLETREWDYGYDDAALGQLGLVQTVKEGMPITLENLTYYTANGSNARIGDLKSMTNAMGHTTTFDNYDVSGRLLQSTDPNGVVTTLAYDSRGRVTTYTVGSRITRYTWDGLGQLKKVVLPDQSSLSYTYDDAHRLTQIQDTAGNLLRMAYDTSSRVIAMDRVNTQEQIVWRREWGYDHYGNVTQERNVRGAAPTIALNQLNPTQNMQARMSITPELVVSTLSVSDDNAIIESLIPKMPWIRSAQALLKGDRS